MPPVKRERKGIQTGQEGNFPFLDDMITYVENPTDSTKRLLELIYEISKVVRYDTDVHMYFYTSSKQMKIEIF